MTDETLRTKAKRLLDELVGLCMMIGSGDTSKETADAVSRLKREILELVGKRGTGK
jgi:diaminopimelate decarboxylase